MPGCDVATRKVPEFRGFPDANDAVASMDFAGAEATADAREGGLEHASTSPAAAVRTADAPAWSGGTARRHACAVRSGRRTAAPATVPGAERGRQRSASRSPDSAPATGGTGDRRARWDPHAGPDSRLGTGTETRTILLEKRLGGKRIRDGKPRACRSRLRGCRPAHERGTRAGKRLPPPASQPAPGRGGGRNDRGTWFVEITSHYLLIMPRRTTCISAFPSGSFSFLGCWLAGLRRDCDRASYAGHPGTGCRSLLQL